MKIFSRLYVSFLEWVATLLAKALGSTMRRLCLAKGKDPDYVALLPPVKEDLIPSREAIEEKLNKFYSAPRTSAMEDGSWVRNVSKHPILEARRQFENSGPHHLKVVGTEPQPPEITSEEIKEIIELSPKETQKEWEEALQVVANEKK